ncbi:hypothetical protein GJAV_G00261150 [Gymnothorax javanicus]|nr:hypothetical protein GJAV_G00261150 [Gymnothorax javanicus]
MDRTPGAVSRIGQVFWEVWNYVSATIQRFVTNDDANTGNNDAQSEQEATTCEATETQGDKFRIENSERAEDKKKENYAVAWDSGCRYSPAREQISVSLVTDQHSVTDIKDIGTESGTEREDARNEPITAGEKEAKGPCYSDEKEENEIHRHGGNSELILQAVRDISSPSSSDEDYLGKRDAEEKPTSGKSMGIESGALCSYGGGEEQVETKDRDGGIEGEHEDHERSDEVIIIRGAEEETEDLREILGQAVDMVIQNDEMDAEQNSARDQEGGKRQIQPIGNSEDGGEFKLLLASGTTEPGDATVETVERGGKETLEEVHDITEESKQEMELATRLTPSAKQGKLDNEDVGSDRNLLNSGGGGQDTIMSLTDEERVDQEELERQVFNEGEEERESERRQFTDDTKTYEGDEINSGRPKLMETVAEDNVKWKDDIRHGADREMDRGFQMEKEIGSDDAGQMMESFDERHEVSGRERENKILRVEESAEYFEDEKITMFEGMEREQRTDSDINDRFEGKVRELEKNWHEVGSILTKTDTVDEGNIETELGGLEGQTAVTPADEESEMFESEREMERGEMAENRAVGWGDGPKEEPTMPTLVSRIVESDEKEVGHSLDPKMEINAPAVDENEGGDEEKHGESQHFEEDREEAVRESECSGGIKEEEMGKLRPELVVSIPVLRTVVGVLNEEARSDVEQNYLAKETETDKYADEKDKGMISAEKHDTVLAMGRNEKPLEEMTMGNKEIEQKADKDCAGLQNMESIDMKETEEKFEIKSRGETEREKLVVEINIAETIQQESEIRGEILQEEDEDMKAKIEDGHHKGAVEKPILEEGDELMRERWKEDSQTQESRGSGPGEEVNAVLEGERCERRDDDDDDSASVEEQLERQFFDLMTEEKQGNRDNDLDPAVQTDGTAVDAGQDSMEEGEIKEDMILKKVIGVENATEVRDSEYFGEMEASKWAIEDKEEEMEEESEVRPEIGVTVHVGGNGKPVVNEEVHTDVEPEHLIKETWADKDAHEKDFGILIANEDERVVDMGNNEEPSGEMALGIRESGQREDRGCSEDKDRENVEVNLSEIEEENVDEYRGEIVGEKSMAETKMEETIRQEVENTEEVAVSGTLAHPEESCLETMEMLAVEESDELTKEEWEEDSNREKGEGSSDGLHDDETLVGDRRERKHDEGTIVEDHHEGRFTELMTDEKLEDRNDLDIIVETDDKAVDAAEDSEVEKARHEGIVSKTETGETNMKDFDESEYREEVEGKVWGTKEEGDESEVRSEVMVPIPIGRDDKVELHDESHSGAGKDCFVNEIVTDEDNTCFGTLRADGDERTSEQTDTTGFSEDRHMENVETDLNVQVEMIRQEVEITGEGEDDEDVKALTEEGCQRGAGEEHASEEGDELTSDSLEEKILRETNVTTAGERKCDGGICEDERFSELMTEGKEDEMRSYLEPAVEIGGIAVNEVEDAREDRKEEQCMIIKEGTEEMPTKEFGEFKGSWEMESSGSSTQETEEKGDETEARADDVRIQDDITMEVSGDLENAELEGEKAEIEEPEVNIEEVKPPEIQQERFDDRETENITTARQDDEKSEGLNVEENEDVKETSDTWIELHAPCLDFAAQKSRMALKNIHSRPPSNYRTLLHAPSLQPTDSKLQCEQPNKASVSIHQGGPMITGFKLPGLGREFPALRKTRRTERERDGVAAEPTPDTTETLKSEREEVGGAKVMGLGAIGVKLPGFGAEFPGLRKTDRGLKLREQTPEKSINSQKISSESSDATDSASAKGIALPAVKLTGFPVLRRTERGARIREGEDAQRQTENSPAEVNVTGFDNEKPLPKAKPRWTPQGKPLIGVGNPSMISELKNKLRKTE